MSHLLFRLDSQRSRMEDGRANVRAVLYMPEISVVRHGPVFQNFS